MRAPGLAAMAAATALLVLGCGAPQGSEPVPTPQVSVTGEFGARPLVQFQTPLDIRETEVSLLVEGEGREVVESGPALLDYLALDATTGEVIADSHVTLPEVRRATPEDLGGPLFETVIGQREGSRVQRLEVGSVGRPNPTVLVVDVLPTRAHGEPQEQQPGGPEVTLQEDGTPVVTFPEGLSAPATSTTTLLQRGTGPQVQAGQSVVVQVHAVRWGSGEVVDSTWLDGGLPRTLAGNATSTGWPAAIIDQNEGSQILLSLPAGQGGDGSALAYVVDVLAVADLALPDLTGTDG